MIARVAIDSEALLDHSEPTRATANTHRSLVQIIESFGFIELLGGPDSTALVEAIKRLTGETSELWEKAIIGLMDLNRVRVGSSDKTTGDQCAERPLPEPLLSLADLVVVSERRSSDREALFSAGFDKSGDEPEFALADSVPHSKTITAVRTLRDLGNYRAQTSREVIWDEVFASPASVSTEATLLDRYFLEHVHNGKSRNARDHVEWMIGKLDESMVAGSTFRLLCGWPVVRATSGLFPQSRIEAVVRKRVAPLIGNGRLRQIEIVLTPWPKRQDDAPHNRHLRFNCGVAVSTDEGFDRLDSNQIQGIDGFSWRGITAATLLGDLATRERVIWNHPDRIELRA